MASVARADLEQNKLTSDLWLYATDGTVERRLTTHPADDSAPVFSPDGKQVAFVSQRDGDTVPQIYTIPLEGGEPTRVTPWRDRVFLAGPPIVSQSQAGWTPSRRWVDPLSEVAQPLSEVVTLGPATEIRGELSGRACTGRFPWRTWTQLLHAAQCS